LCYADCYCRLIYSHKKTLNLWSIKFNFSNLWVAQKLNEFRDTIQKTKLANIVTRHDQ
jgi:hypothetical protein